MGGVSKRPALKSNLTVVAKLKEEADSQTNQNRVPIPQLTEAVFSAYYHKRVMRKNLGAISLIK